MLSKKEINALFRFYFRDHDKNAPFVPYNYQLKIADAILNKRSRYIDILATTRAGKSLILAKTAILYGLHYPNSKIRLIAPIFEQVKILMGYIIDHLGDHEIIIGQLPLIRSDNAKMRIQMELTKNKIKFNNGSEFKTLSAHGDGKRLQGWGGDLIIVDEAINIPDEIYQTYVARLLEHEDSIMVKIGNPTHKNHFYLGWKSGNHLTIVVDCWECVKDGRFTKEEVEDKAREMGGWDTPQVKAMLLCEWVDGGDNQLIHDSWIENALTADLELQNPYFVIGVDVARFGKDSTVITTILRDDARVIMENVTEIFHMDNVAVSQGVINEFARIQDKYKVAPEVIVVDDMGLGGGVVDILRNKNYSVFRFIAGQKSDGQLYFNKKAEAGWKLRQLFEAGNIKIKNNPKLIRDLSSMIYEYRSDKTIQLKDPSKSPDFFDSLMMACNYFKLQMVRFKLIN